MGTPQFAVPVLQALCDDGNVVVDMVITQPDKPANRGKIMTPPPVKVVAEELGLAIVQPDNVNGDDVVRMISDVDPDFIVVVAYGQILDKEVLSLAKTEILNVHASLLPKCRGASPIQSAILSGDEKTGVSVMGVRRKMDAGPVYLTAKTVIGDKDFLGLSEELSELGARSLLKVIKDFNSFVPKDQDHNSATYCKKVTRKDGLVSFQGMDSAEILRRYKAFYGWPGIFTKLGGKRLILSEIAHSDIECCSEPGCVCEVKSRIYVTSKDNSSIELKRVKLEGKKEMNISDFIRGHQDFLGSYLA